MDQEPLVEAQIEEGLAFAKSIDPLLGVKAAYWLKVPDRADWRLHIVTEKVKDDGKFEFYPELIRTYLDGDFQSLSSDQLTLDLENDRIGRNVVEFKNKYMTTKAKQLRNQPIGGEYIHGAYIYAYPPSSN